MIWGLISAIIGLATLFIKEWLKLRGSQNEALEKRNKVLEKIAAEKRKKEQAENEALAKELRDRRDIGRTIGFVLDSFRKRPSVESGVQPPGVAGGTRP